MKPEEVKNEKQEQELQDEELEQAAGGDAGIARVKSIQELRKGK